MGVPMLTFLPQMGMPQAQASGTPSNAGGDRFEQLLSAIAEPLRAADRSNDAGGDGQSSSLLGLQEALQALTQGKLDLARVGLGLTKQQLHDFVVRLRQLLDASNEDGTQLLTSLLAGSQVLNGKAPSELTALLATGADGSVSASDVVNNVQLLAQAIQLVDQSDGQITLGQALQELAPPGDVFADKLGQLLSPEQPELAQLLQRSLGPPGSAGRGEAHPPPQGGEAPVTSATAGSNGPEMTPASAGNPSDGAGNEVGGESQTSSGGPIAWTNEDSSELSEIVKALHALLSKQETGPNFPSRPGATLAQPGSVDSGRHALSPETTGAALPAAASESSGSSQVLASGAAGSGSSSAAGNGQVSAGASVPAEQQNDAGRNLSSGAGLPEAEKVAAPAGPRQQETFDQAPGQSDGDRAQSKPQPKLTPSSSLPSAGGGPQVLTLPGTPPAFPAVASVGGPQPTLLDQSVVQQIVQQATVALQGGQQEFRIQLKPDFLGALEIRVSMDSTGAAVVKMAAENPATRQLIDANLAQLRQAFGTTQVRVEYVPSFNGWDATSTAFGQGGGFWQGQYPQGNSNQLPPALPFVGEPAAAGLLAAGAPDAAAQPLAAGTRSEIDLTA